MVESKPNATQSATEGKKPYEPPCILSREPLEAVAAVCSPSPPAKANPGACASGPISS